MTKIDIRKGTKERELINEAIRAVRKSPERYFLSARGILKAAAWKIWARNGGRYDKEGANAMMAIHIVIPITH